MHQSSSPDTNWLFVDESGQLFKTSSFVCAVVVTNELAELNKAVRRGKGNMKPPLGPRTRFHAREVVNPANVGVVLKQLCQHVPSIRFVVGILNHDVIWRQDLGEKAIYNMLMGYTIQQALTIASVPLKGVRVVIERRSASKKVNRDLTTQVANSTSLEFTQIAIEHWNHSVWGNGLQAADAVAWSIGSQLGENVTKRKRTYILDSSTSEVAVGIDTEGNMRPRDLMLGEDTGEV